MLPPNWFFSDVLCPTSVRQLVELSVETVSQCSEIRSTFVMIELECSTSCLYIYWPCDSFRYFQAAEKQLEAETGEIQLPTIQARLLQCFYLLSRSRKHQCWSIFGTVINLIFATSLHRKFGSPDSGGRQQDLILSECQKRVFWVAYVLDRYLSVALGNPQMIHDEDIDQVCLSHGMCWSWNHANTWIRSFLPWLMITTLLPQVWW
jgi:hypothetical protein